MEEVRIPIQHDEVLWSHDLPWTNDGMTYSRQDPWLNALYNSKEVSFSVGFCAVIHRVIPKFARMLAQVNRNMRKYYQTNSDTPMEEMKTRLSPKRVYQNSCPPSHCCPFHDFKTPTRFILTPVIFRWAAFFSRRGK